MTKGPTLGLQAERAWRAWRARRARYGRVAGSAAGVHGAIFSGHGRGGGNVPWQRAAGVQEEPGNKGNPTEKAADKAALAAFLLNKYGPGGSSKLAAAEAATSTDEQVVREGQKTTREERTRSATRSCAWRGAMSL